MYGYPNDPLESLEYFQGFLFDYLSRHPAVLIRDLIHAAIRQSHTTSFPIARRRLRLLLANLERTSLTGREFAMSRVWLPQLPDVQTWRAHSESRSPDILVTYDRFEAGIPTFTVKSIHHCIIWSRPILVCRGNTDQWGFQYNDASRLLNLHPQPPSDALAAAAVTVSTLCSMRLPKEIPFVPTPVVCAGPNRFDESHWGISYDQFISVLTEDSALSPMSTGKPVQYRKRIDVQLCTLAMSVNVLGFLRESAEHEPYNFQTQCLDHAPWMVMEHGVPIGSSYFDGKRCAYLGNPTESTVTRFLVTPQDFREVQLW